MKLSKILINALVLLVAPIFTMAQEPAYHIKVKIKGLSNTQCYLGNYYGDKQYVKDTSKVDASGNFSFKGKEKLPGGIYLIITPEKKYFEAIVTADNQHFTMETDTLDFIKHMKIKGSEENLLFYNYLNFIAEKSKSVEPLKKELDKVKNNKDSAMAIRKKMAAIDKDVKDYQQRFIKEHPNSFSSVIFKASTDPEVPEAPKLPNGAIDSTFGYRYYKAHFFDNIDFSDDRLVRTPIFHRKLEQYIKNLTYQIPDSICKAADLLVSKATGIETFKYTVWYITNTYETSNIMGMDAVFVYMVEKYYTKEKATWLDATQLFKIQEAAGKIKRTLLGKKAPGMLLNDSSGVAHNLYSIKTPYTVLFFWDPDCGHCQKTIPFLVDFNEKYKSKGVTVMAVCTEVEDAKWRKFIKEKKLNFLNVADPKMQSNFRYEYNISSTPQVFLLDSTKTIIAKKLDIDQLDDFLTKHEKIK